MVRKRKAILGLKEYEGVEIEASVARRKRARSSSSSETEIWTGCLEGKRYGTRKKITRVMVRIRVITYGVDSIFCVETCKIIIEYTFENGWRK